MSFATMRATLEGHMATNWTASKVAYENVPFDIPNVPWVRFTIITGQGYTEGILGMLPVVRDEGLVSLQVFAPEGQGTNASRGLVDSFLALFEHKRIGTVTTYSASVRTVGVSDGWHQINVSIPFRRSRYVGS